jgi:hypothetical protein
VYAPVFAVDRFLKGESKSIATMPMLKICTPPPDMYSMNACIGSDLSGEIANSQAFFVFRASCELSASAAAVADADADVVTADDLPDPLSYDWKCETESVSSAVSHFRHGCRVYRTHL